MSDEDWEPDLSCLSEGVIVTGKPRLPGPKDDLELRESIETMRTAWLDQEGSFMLATPKPKRTRAKTKTADE